MSRSNGWTRQAILKAIKLQGSATTDELGRELTISSVAVRQHLSSLEAEGKVTLTVERRGLGRPVHRYTLTEAGDEGFQRSYDRLGIDLLEAVRETQGEEGLATLLGIRRNRIVADVQSQLEGANLATRVEEAAKLQNDLGFMVTVNVDGDDLTLTEFNCAVCRVARKHAALCEDELNLFRDFAGPGASVEREKHILLGDTACVYRFSVATPADDSE